METYEYVNKELAVVMYGDPYHTHDWVKNYQGSGRKKYVCTKCPGVALVGYTEEEILDKTR